MREKLKCIFKLFAFQNNTCFVCNSIGNLSIEGAITSILKHLKSYCSKTHLIFFSDFCRKFYATTWNIKLITFGASNWKNKKSVLSMWLNKGVIKPRETNDLKEGNVYYFVLFSPFGKLTLVKSTWYLLCLFSYCL